MARDPEPIATIVSAATPSDENSEFKVDIGFVDDPDPVDEMFPPQPPSPTTMSLEFAKGIKNSAGVAYNDIPTDKLSFMANQLMKQTDDQSRMKLDAVKIILASRTEGES